MSYAAAEAARQCSDRVACSPRSASVNQLGNRIIPWVRHFVVAICCGLKQLLPLIMQIVGPRGAGAALFRFLLF